MKLEWLVLLCTLLAMILTIFNATIGNIGFTIFWSSLFISENLLLIAVIFEEKLDKKFKALLEMVT